MATHYNVGEELRGERIAVQARDIDALRVQKGSSSHKIQATTLRHSAYCVIEMPLKAVGNHPQTPG